MRDSFWTDGRKRRGASCCCKRVRKGREEGGSGYTGERERELENEKKGGGPRRQMKTKGTRREEEEEEEAEEEEREVPAESGANPGCRGSTEGTGRRGGREGKERFARGPRRLDAGFFQQGHGRMDVGIMEASTVPSLPDKNCRWKKNVDEGDEGADQAGRRERRTADASGKRRPDGDGATES